ncbi:MAG: heparinase II/III family protein [Clostridia bacterium]|nr:heparinase II/III family protein [Clostridia bacterium]
MYLYSYERLKEKANTKQGKEFLGSLRKIYEEDYENKPILALPFSKFKLFHINGDRVLYQNEYFDRRKRLMLLQVLALADDKYLEPLEDVISAICDEITWCIPAHCLDRETGNTYKYYEIDLFASETAFYLAETDYIFKDKLCPEIRNRIKYSLKKKIVDVYENTIFGFDTMKNNWATVCSCGIGITYLYAFPERFNGIKDRIFSAMERYLVNALGGEGYCSEGFSYWVYGFGFLALFFDVYCQLTGDRPSILDREEIKNTLEYGKNAILDGGIFLPIADGGSKGEHNESPVLYVINRLFNTNIVLNNGREIEADTQVLGTRVLAGIDQKALVEEEKLGCVYFKTNQVLVRKKGGYTLVAKGGNNAEMHNHNDIGAFAIIKNGKQYICDPGVGEYTNGYFNSPKVRYSKETFVCSAYAHSIPVIDGKTQVFGKEYEAKLVDRNDDFITFDLTNAYPDNKADIKVTYKTLDNGVKAIYKISNASSVTFRFVSFIEPKVDGNSVLLDEMAVTNSLGVTPTFERVDYSGFLKRPKTAYIIDYTVEGCDISAEFDFKF